VLNNILSLASATTTVTVQSLLICTLASLVCGVGVALIYMFRNQYTKSFVPTLVLMPAMVQLIIILVNGNLGTGVAVMGAFSLVRFRSVPGSARDIASIFFAMAIGLATGAGYIFYAFLFLIIIGLASMLLTASRFGEGHGGLRELKITIPESLDYNGVFDDLMEKYTRSVKLMKVKTSNMGSLYELHYRIMLKNAATEKEFIDQLRCRNGNLNITCGLVPTGKDEL